MLLDALMQEDEKSAIDYAKHNEKLGVTEKKSLPLSRKHRIITVVCYI